MSRTWARQALDVNIMEKLYETKALRGKTLAKLYTPDKMQRGYDRLDALKKNGMIEGVAYCEHVNIGSNENPVGRKKKMGTMFYLTARGVEEVKQLKGIPVDGTERTVRPEDEQMIALFTASLLVENTGLNLVSGREFKIENKLPNFVTIDLVYNDWLVIIERETNLAYRRKLCQQIKGMSKNRSLGNFLIITRAEVNRPIAIRSWKDEFGPNTRFMVRNNYEGIKRVITNNTMPEIIKVIEQNKGPVRELPQPEDGFTHTVNGERCVIVDLIGFSTRALRNLSSTLSQSHKAHVGVEGIADLKIIANRFPELLRPGFEFFTLDGINGTSEAISMMYGNRRGV